jgi:hypothetical protein
MRLEAWLAGRIARKRGHDDIVPNEWTDLAEWYLKGYEAMQKEYKWRRR